MNSNISKINIILIFSIVCITFSCTTLKKRDCIGKSNPSSKRVINKYFDAKLTPIFLTWDDFYIPEMTINYQNGIGVVFKLDVRNNCDKNIEIDWNETYYLSMGQQSGGFLFEGTDFKNTDSYKPPELLIPSYAMTKVIVPNRLLFFNKNWCYSFMKPGENGIYLSVDVDGVKITEKITVDISYISRDAFRENSRDKEKEEIRGQLESLRKELERTKSLME